MTFTKAEIRMKEYLKDRQSSGLKTPLDDAARMVLSEFERTESDDPFLYQAAVSWLVHIGRGVKIRKRDNPVVGQMAMFASMPDSATTVFTIDGVSTPIQLIKLKKVRAKRAEIRANINGLENDDVDLAEVEEQLVAAGATEEQCAVDLELVV